MESIEDTPTKRRKLSAGNAAQSLTYDSQDDSGDELFAHHNTVDTVQLPSTQPTQILSQPTLTYRRDETVQVPVSSPTPGQKLSPAASSKIVDLHESIAKQIAPAGTVFRPPLSVSRKVPQKTVAVVELSDDDEGPSYRGGSSEDDYHFGHKADIKPSNFIQNTRKSINIDNLDRFKNITSQAVYNPSNQAERQSAPSKAQVVDDLNINDILDLQLKTKINRIRSILPSCSVQACKSALIKAKSNFDDACDLLTSPDGPLFHHDLKLSRGQSLVQKPLAKQQIKAPAQKIHEKWTKPPQNSPTANSIVSSTGSPPKARRRLVRGRKILSSPICAPATEFPPSTVSPRGALSLDSEDDNSTNNDSAIGTEVEDTTTDRQVLEFFNTCSTPDLSDIANISEETATLILTRRPFKSLQQIREINAEPQGNSKKKASSKKPLGDKIVEKSLEMWIGYEAIDNLVRQCNKIGNLVKEDMEKWGINIYGCDSKDGELELANFESISTDIKDSALGTPSSRSSPVEDGNRENTKISHQRNKDFFPQPSIMAPGIVLKDYQIVGVNWLSLLFEKNLSCILADDMGLGKTCQVIAFFAHLFEKGIKGPHLIIVPGSTLENWLREFSVFCPKLAVMPYYANQNERPNIRTQIEAASDSLNVLITTYGIAKIKEDNKFLRRLKPVVCVYDEGHYLRNSQSAGYHEYMRINARFRLLLTGTPLQNNLRELASLLGFILPSVFQEHSEELEAVFNHKAKTTDSDQSHAALLSAQRIARAKSMMTPFVLRRKKHQVLKHLPRKARRVEYCDLSPAQAELYDKEKSHALTLVAARKAGKKTGNESSNIMMALRKASLHPLLFRRLYDDKTIGRMAKACSREEEFRQSNIDLIYEDMEVMTDAELHRFCLRYPYTMSDYALRNEQWMDSGKVSKLSRLLETYKKDGDRVLVFSQFVMVMDILEAVMETLNMQYFRLDGRTKIDERQDMIDQFYKEPEITVFLLSTKAGGAGINLACANKVIIFDSSFNPQVDDRALLYMYTANDSFKDDIQAENRAHRVGQTREVEIVRLVSKNTIEEQIHALGETKLALDERVAGTVDADMDNAKIEKQGQKAVENIILGIFDKEAKQ